ncbi:hypothetical protein CCUG62472_01063 [Mycobacteroides salmoniphilum]|nr:hypothetical protein CCUG62472_01063 [Mycobacteroides salmoniphilum]
MSIPKLNMQIARFWLAARKKCWTRSVSTARLSGRGLGMQYFQFIE